MTHVFRLKDKRNGVVYNAIHEITVADGSALETAGDIETVDSYRLEDGRQLKRRDDGAFIVIGDEEMDLVHLHPPLERDPEAVRRGKQALAEQLALQARQDEASKTAYADLARINAAAEEERIEREYAAALAEAALREKFPPPTECERCGEAIWDFVSLSPNNKSAKYACGYCQRAVIVKATDVAARAANRGRQPVPKEIQMEVWRRDNGKCVCCGSKENLEFDHIIAVALGGATTVRNLQLLCQTCNRKKSAKEPGHH